jgi:hypothetical protein
LLVKNLRNIILLILLQETDLKKSERTLTINYKQITCACSILSYFNTLK